MAVELEFDYSNLMGSNVGLQHGLQEAEIAALQPLVDRIHKQLADDIDEQCRHRELGFWDLPHTMREELPSLQAAAEQFKGLADAHLILGIGGSYLGARMLFDGLCHRYWNELPADRRGGWPRIYFEGNGVDNDSFADLLDRLGDQPLTVHVVSKSGETLETGLAFRAVRQRLGDQVKGWAFTTGDDTRVDRFCRSLDLPNLQVFRLPDNVGGRDSVLTPVGLFPAAMMGLQLDQLLDGAHQMRDCCHANSHITRNPAYLYAGLQHLSELAGRNISVMAVWSKALESFGLWYDQLSAESLGKEGRGRTPLTAVCTRELHSRGQQHQAGSRDKVITNLFVREPNREKVRTEDDPGDDAERAIYASERIPTAEEQGRTDGYFFAAGRSFAAVNEFAFMATDSAYAKDQRPGLSLTVPRLDEEHLGALIFLFELATVVEGRLMAINPLNQPGVQAYKDFLTGLLGKPGLEAYRDECLALRAATKGYVLNVGSDI
ncbi:MAG: hypothetical protein IT204_13295 [Fimbriimonadaceae bacterium]|nr:hypothetical protein [Fimbriimonadaceae bacterium]